MKKSFSVKETAELLGVTKKAIYDEITNETLKHIRVGKRIRITQPDLEQRFGKERIRAMLRENGGE